MDIGGFLGAMALALPALILLLIFSGALGMLSAAKTVFRDSDGNIVVRAGDKVAWEAEGEHCEGFIAEINNDIALVDLYRGHKKFGDRKTLHL